MNTTPLKTELKSGNKDSLPVRKSRSEFDENTINTTQTTFSTDSIKTDASNTYKDTISETMNGNISIDLCTKSIDWSRYSTFVETEFSYCNTFVNKVWNEIDTTAATFFLGFLITEAIRRWNKGRELTQNKYFIEKWVNESNNTLDQYITALRNLPKTYL